ncbi:Metallo-dependent phosphatase-like protein [Lentinula edodes]|uniref:Metallo-dependent phosphatase-like protein n=1 Tax=Lentinula edodes TaxID=5353 RepID=UPI001E8E4691|nr:Metallo-dependent phosphatase-like protein [Lentinula edodes]KAH7872015.1 Metallo-dependent phosphatase-like protein [Lentinula edodes]
MHLSAALLSVALPLALRVTVNACSDEHAHDHNHAHQKRLFPQTQLTKPTRPLEWGELNIIHTTDTHGWLLGHQHASFPEPNYSGDLGDFASFVQHMKQLAIEKDVDLLLVDSGDLHDGTGLSDGFPAGGIDAHDANQFIKQLPYDIMAIGNHELYDYINTWDMYTNFVPALDGKYLSSNVNITVFDANNNTIDVPVGNRFRKFTTRKGRKITSLGVLYDFTGNDVNTTVQSVADMVKEQWFAEAIAEEPDVFLLVGHMPVSRDNWPAVFNAVRAVHAETPIIILGGHSHIRDCNQPDGRSMALESGRYMETIGWLSANLGSSSDVNAKNNISFSRRYLDQNRVTYEYHSQQSNNSFDTREGQNITQGLLDLGVKYDLSMLFGIAPQDFTISRDPYPSNGSSLTLFINEAAPYSLTLNNTRANISNIMITNSGSQRFDIYSGTFDKNDQISASPFTDAFMFIKDLPLGVAQEVLPALNAAGADERRKRDLGSVLQERESEMWKRGYVNMRYMEWLDEMDRRHNGAVKRASQNLTLGYVTSDSCPGVGDDTIHAPLASFDIPDFIGSDTPSLSNDSLVDLVFVDFIQEQLLEILNEVQNATTYTDSDVASYTDVLSNAVLGLYAQHAWN